MKRVLILCSKIVKDKENKEFTSYYGYLQTAIPGTNPVEYEDLTVDVAGADGVVTKKSLCTNVKLCNNAEIFVKQHKEFSFPLLITINEGAPLLDPKGKALLGSNGKPLTQAFTTVDKDKNGKARLDKNGKKHLILVINEFESVIEAPRKTYTLDDLGSYEG